MTETSDRVKLGVVVFARNEHDFDRYAASYSEPPGTTAPAVSDATTFADAFRLGRLAEPLGYDSLWCTEHHFAPTSMTNNTLQLLSYFAGCTERVEMGTMAVILPWHDPIRVAEEIILLDHMLGGRRLHLGFGRGAGRREASGLRSPADESRRRFWESLEIVRAALTHEWFSYDGEHYTIPRISLRPSPRSADLVERMSYAVGSAESLPMAAEAGLRAMLLPKSETWEEMAAGVAAFNRRRAECGYSHANTYMHVLVHCAPSADQAEEVAREHVALFLSSTFRQLEHGNRIYGDGAPPGAAFAALSGLSAETVDLSDIRIQVWGTPDQCVEQLEHIATMIGVEHFALGFRYGGMPMEVAEASMRLFAAEALPEVQRLPVVPMRAEGLPAQV